jgi:hypothetical protein
MIKKYKKRRGGAFKALSKDFKSKSKSEIARIIGLIAYVSIILGSIAYLMYLDVLHNTIKF